MESKQEKHNTENGVRVRTDRNIEFGGRARHSTRRTYTTLTRDLKGRIIGRNMSSQNEAFPFNIVIALSEEGVIEEVSDPKSKALFIARDGVSNEIASLVTATEAAVKKHTEATEQVEKELDSLEIDKLSENKLVLLQRFVKQRNEFLNTFSTIDAKGFCDLLNIKDKNHSRSLKRLREKGEILALETNDGYLYPEFQVNEYAVVYPPLKEALPKLYAHLNGWDIAFWLTKPRTVVTSSYELSEESAKEMKESATLDDLAQAIEAKVGDSGSIIASPLELLENEEYETFLNFVNEYLSPESQKPRREVI